MSTQTAHRFGGPVVRHPLWWMGWRPRPTIAGANMAGFVVGNGIMIPASLVTGGNGLLTVAGLTLLGFVAGVCLWGLGVREVNRNADRVRTAFQERLCPAVEDSYDLIAGQGTAYRVAPAKRYTLSRVTVADRELTIFQGDLDMVRRRSTGERTLEIPLDTIRAVSAGDGTVTVETESDEYRIPASADSAGDDPTEVAAAISTVASTDGA